MRSSPSTRTTRSGGFTLAELALAMVVLVLLTGMAIPSLKGLQGSRQKETAVRVRTVLVQAQTWALHNGLKSWVSLDPRTDRITAFVENRTKPGKGNRLSLLDPLTRSALSLQLGQAGIGIESVDIGRKDEVMFDPLGVPHDSNEVLLDSDGIVVITGGVTVRITRHTGLVTID